MSTHVHRGITVTFDGSPDVHILTDKGILVQPNTRILSVTPAESTTTTGVRNGASINKMANEGLPTFGQPAGVATQPYEGRHPWGTYPNPGYATTSKLTLPYTMLAGDQIVFTKSVAEGFGTEHNPVARAFWPGDGESYIDEALSISCVSYDTTPADGALLGFGRTGNGATVRLLRDQRQLPVSRIDTSLLPSTINWGTLTTGSLPTIAFYETVFAEFGVPLIAGSITRYWSPNQQGFQYGEVNAHAISQALMHLCRSDITASAKATLAELLVQRGLDYAGMWMDGQYSKPSGGQAMGEKFLIILAGRLLGITELQDPDTWIMANLGTPGELKGQRFAESARISQFPVNTATDAADNFWWHGDADWDLMFSFNDIGDGNFLRYAPTTWTTGNVFGIGGYMFRSMGAMMGIGLAANLFGLDTEMGVDFMRFLEHYMLLNDNVNENLHGPGATAIAAMIARDPVLGPPSPPGQNWGYQQINPSGFGDGLCQEVWNLHFTPAV